jgi:hypothetical protein
MQKWLAKNNWTNFECPPEVWTNKKHRTPIHFQNDYFLFGMPKSY